MKVTYLLKTSAVQKTVPESGHGNHLYCNLVRLLGGWKLMTNHFPPLYLTENVSLVAGKKLYTVLRYHRILYSCFETVYSFQNSI